MRRLLAAFAILLAIEVIVLIAIGQAIGVGPTLGLVAVTSAIGSVLLVTEGRRSWRIFRADFNERRPWGNAALDGLLVLVGTVLIVIPGFVSDVLGVLLVLPPTRNLARRGLLRAYGGRLSPADMTTLFGPRRVRARPGPTYRPGPPPEPEQMVDGGKPIEGEIMQ